MQFASFSFDAAVWEFANAFLSGGILFVIKSVDVTNVIKSMNKLHVNWVLFPPVFLNEIDLSLLSKYERIIYSGGDVIEKGKNIFEKYDMDRDAYLKYLVMEELKED